MSVYQNTIPNLLAGVSQQAAQLRLSTQGAVQINGMSSLTKGLGKRPPGILNKVIGAVTGASTAYIHEINRDATEQYMVMLVDGNLKVYDRRTGIEKTVNFESVTVFSLDDQAGIGNGTAYQVKLKPGDTSLSVITTGIAGGATVLLQESTTGAWAGEETTKATITTNTTTVVATLTHGRYYRCRKSVAGTGTCDATMAWKRADYLDVVTPRTDFAAVTVADHTFIINKTVTAIMDTRTSPTRNPEALVHVIAGAYSKEYTITIDGTQRGMVRLPDGADKKHYKFAGTTAIAYALKKAISTVIASRDADLTDFNLTGSAGADMSESDIVGTAFIDGTIWKCDLYGNVLHIYRTDTTDFTISSTDDNNNINLKSIKGATQRFSDLPPVAPADFLIEVSGESSNQFDNFHVRYDAVKKVWVESMPETTLLGFDSRTMPHILVREADLTFTFKRATWDDRAVGDEDTNSQPSFIGQTIRDVTYYRNRLGLVSGENTILSRSGDPFNFWRSTVTAVLDTDPIDVGTTSAEVAIINYAIPMNDNLILFCDQVQERITGGELLSPRSIANHPLSAYPMTPNVRPALAGNHVLFVKSYPGSSSVHEYWIDNDTGDVNQLETANHCPSFVPANVFSLKSSRVGGWAVALSSDQLNRLYMYKSYWSGNEKVQSSWSYWALATGTTVIGAAFFDTDLVVMTLYNSSVHLITIPLEDNYVDVGMAFPILIDHRVISTDLSAGTYDAANLRTSYTLPYDATGAQAWTAYDSDGPYDPGLELEVNSVVTTTIRLVGNTTAQKIYFGLPYTYTYTFSDLYVRRETSNGGSVPLVDARTQVLRMTLKYADTGAFAVAVTPEARNTFTYAYSALGSTIDDPDYLLDSVVLEEGQFSFPVKCQNTKVAITVTNDQALPCWFLSADWLATYQPKHKRAQQ